MRRLWHAVLCALLVVSAQAVSKASFGVRAKILSGWKSTPLLAHSLEWIRDVDPQQTGAFVKEATDAGVVSGPTLAIAERRLQSKSARTFHELLARNSYYGPRVEMLRTRARLDRVTLGSTCDEAEAWALIWNGGVSTVACNVSALNAALNLPSVPAANLEPPETRTFDVTLHAGSKNLSRSVFIYGALSRDGLKSLAPFVKETETRSASGVRVVFRHSDGPADIAGLDADALTGYGMELAIKSSEYKTHVDEEKVEEERESEVEKGDDEESEDSLLTDDTSEEPLELDGLKFHTLRKRYRTLQSRLRAFQEQLEVERDADVVVKAWEIKDIGLQATAKIQASKTPLLTMMRLSQNFPAHVVGLSRLSVPEKLRKQKQKLRRMVREQGEVFSVNGRLVRPDHMSLSIFPIIKSLLPYFVGIERLTRLGIDEKVACEILKASDGTSAPERLDWRSPLLPPPIYDVMKDKKTARWGDSLEMLLYFMGGLAAVRLPLYKTVFAFDPAEVSDVQSAITLLSRMPMPASLHFVLVDGRSTAEQARWDDSVLGSKPDWLVEGGTESTQWDVSRTIAAGFGALLSRSPLKARKFLKGLADESEDWVEKHSRWPGTSEGWRSLQKIWSECLAADEKHKWKELWEEEVVRKSTYVTNSAAYVSNLGIPVPSILVNGRLLLKSSYDGPQSIFGAIGQEQQNFQQAVYTGALRDEAAVDDFIASMGVLSAYHPDITPSLAQEGGEDGMPGEHDVQVRYVQWPGSVFTSLPFLRSIEPESSVDDNSGGEGSHVGLFHVVVIRDLNHGYLLHTFASHLLSPDRASVRSNTQVVVPPLTSRWAVIVEPNSDAGEELRACVRATLRLTSSDSDVASSLNRQKLSMLKFLGAALSSVSTELLTAGRVRELCLLGVRKKIDPELSSGFADLVRGGSAEEATLLGALEPSLGATWVCNGRQINLEAAGQPLSPGHVQTLEMMEAQYDVSKVEATTDGESQTKPVKLLHEWLGSSTSVPFESHALIAAVRSEALSHGRGEAFTQPQEVFDTAPSAFRLHVPPAEPDAAVPIRLIGIVNPLSTTAQSASALFALVGMAFNAEVSLVLNPVMSYSEYPLKRYYREVIQWPERLADGRAAADLDDGQIGGGLAEFAGLATKHVLTAAMHVMPTWLVAAHEAEYDMDNLRLVDVGDGKTCDVTYVLKSLYVEGQAFVLNEAGWPTAPAKNLQVDVLQKGALYPHDDTIVMGNLGYFQMHGNPGVYELKLKPVSNQSFVLANTKEVEVASYITPPYQLRVRSRETAAHEEASQGVKGLFNSLMSSVWGDSEKGASSHLVKEGHAVRSELPTIHIFSVASGHLYEKLLGIMMLSVRTHTTNPLHFWFVDNFLSPKFKEFIPIMAQRYNFKVDFVTYKWPSWLNPQSEKQRLIWAYKILFLDVLFPVDVSKIIFVDADQVVRADVKELWDTDLKGNVYGFVPMGDTNPDVEGFRFWKQGYWQSHLNGKPYHISALFVVDLDEFRRTSTGDVLRSVYNQLSRDPASLANLDQDLPNFAQHQVPIFSLPSDWLWCETWCSQEVKPRAKTIDLCQNPLTKEPKIAMATRIISEWQSYHDAVQTLQEEVWAEKQELSSKKEEL